MLVSAGFFRQYLCRLTCYGNRTLRNEWRQVSFPILDFLFIKLSFPSLRHHLYPSPQKSMVSPLKVSASLLTVVLWTPTSQVLCLASLISHYNSLSSLHGYCVSGMVVSNSPAFAFFFFFNSHDGWWVKFYYHLHFGVKETGLTLSVCVCMWVIHVWFSATPWTVACQGPLSMWFSRQEYWSGLPFPAPSIK